MSKIGTCEIGPKFRVFVLFCFSNELPGGSTQNLKSFLFRAKRDRSQMQVISLFAKEVVPQIQVGFRHLNKMK